MGEVSTGTRSGQRRARQAFPRRLASIVNGMLMDGISNPARADGDIRARRRDGSRQEGRSGDGWKAGCGERARSRNDMDVHDSEPRPQTICFAQEHSPCDGLRGTSEALFEPFRVGEADPKPPLRPGALRQHRLRRDQQSPFERMRGRGKATGTASSP